MAVANGLNPSFVNITLGGVNISTGTGVPTGTAPKGSLYIRLDGSSASTRMYINTTGLAVWTNFTSAA